MKKLHRVCYFSWKIVSYEDIKTHELQCGYQPLECRGCHNTILKTAHADHEDACEQIELKCSECNLIYKRGDTTTSHTDVMCLKNQLRQLRQEFETDKQQIHEHIQKLSEKMEQLPKTFQEVFDVNKQQTNERIQLFRQDLDIYKQQTGEKTREIQENFQKKQERSDDDMQQLIRRLNRK